MSAFPSVNLVQSAVFNSSGVTMQSGKKIVLSGPATAALEPVSFGQFSDKVSILDVSLNAVKQVIDDVIQDASGSFNSLVELYNISKTIESSGVASLTAETSARQVKDTELDSRLFTIRNVAVAGGVYADAQQPSDIPTALLDVVDPLNPNIITDDGWYYKSPGQIPGAKSGEKKINWYVAPNATTVSGLKEVNMPVNLINPKDAPFFTIYTKFQGNDPTDYGVGKKNGGWWYHGRYTFLVPSTLTSKGKYNFRVSMRKVDASNNVVVDGSAPHEGSYAGYSNIDMAISFNSTVQGNSAGLAVIPFLATDEILSCAFGSNSGAEAGDVEFILSAVNYYCSAGNVGYRFNNADVLAKKLKATMGASP